MNPIAAILQLFGAVTGLTNATTRLVQAAKDSEPPPEPPKPLGHSGAPLAQEYMRGRTDELYRQQDRERMTGDARRLAELAAQDDDAGPSEQPVDEDKTP